MKREDKIKLLKDIVAGRKTINEGLPPIHRIWLQDMDNPDLWHFGAEGLTKRKDEKLPDEILGRAKTGFTTPIANWQQSLDTQKQWQKKNILRHASCPWARRWAYKVLPV